MRGGSLPRALTPQKLEGGREKAPQIAALSDAGIPVMAHIGMLPQSVHAEGGYRIKGRSEEDAARLLADAAAVEKAGAFAVVAGTGGGRL
jgi:3-methyl-2-oxobutanoate hydroxymethyltransferase